MRHRVLFVSYFFPPLGGAGVQRTVKFAKYLPEFGWEPLMVTGPGVTGDEWAPLDKSLSDETRDVQVVRTKGFLPREGGGGRLANLVRKTRGQSAFDRWWPDAATAAARTAPAADVVLGTMSPFQTSRAAAEIAAARGIPWVADLRDPWALDEMFVYATGFHRRRAETAMGRSLASGAAIIMNTTEARARLLSRFPEFDKRRVVVIPNGFDAEDFIGPPTTRDDHSFRIVHTGYLHVASGLELRRRGRTRRALGGMEKSLDTLTRSHLFLLQAIDRLEQRRPDLTKFLELHLAGAATEQDRSVRSSKVVFHGYLRHSASVALMRSADLLFLPMHDLSPGRRATIIPGKTYEYLAAEPPILAAVPDGDARDLLAATGKAYVVRPADVAGMMGALERAIESKMNGSPLPHVPRALLDTFERRTLTARLACLLDGVASSVSAVD